MSDPWESLRNLEPEPVFDTVTVRKHVLDELLSDADRLLAFHFEDVLALESELAR